ncbi:MAG: hypothetical protein ABI721_04950 [Candidatus Dojkabacteria bacterium]
MIDDMVESVDEKQIDSIDNTIRTSAARFGFESWKRGLRSVGKEPGYPRTEKFHPGMLPFDFMQAVKNADWNVEDKKSLFLQLLDPYEETMTTLEYESVQNTLKNITPENLNRWIEELTVRWAVANDNWGDAAIFLAMMLIGKEIEQSVDQNSLVELTNSDYKEPFLQSLNKLKTAIDNLTSSATIRATMDQLDQNDLLRNLIINIHGGWREDKYKLEKLDKYNGATIEELLQDEHIVGAGKRLTAFILQVGGFSNQQLTEEYVYTKINEIIFVERNLLEKTSIINPGITFTLLIEFVLVLEAITNVSSNTQKAIKHIVVDLKNIIKQDVNLAPVMSLTDFIVRNSEDNNINNLPL